MSPRDPIRRRRPARGFVGRAIEAAVLLGIAGIMCGEFLVEGWPTPIVVSSGSMATTLLGPHRMVRCPACGLEFAIDAASESEPAPATCPNCGRAGIEPSGPIVAGDRLLIDRGTYLLRRPRRWETALFRCSDQARDYCVKRIVGLPGEAVEIRDGDVYIDGAIARKSLAQQRAMAVVVHDTAWPADGSLPNRWSGQAGSEWQASNGGWRCTPRAARDNWLNYVHWRRRPGSPPPIAESPVLDEDGYNQKTSRQLNPVTDPMLVCQLSAGGSGSLLLKAGDGRDEFLLTIEPATGAIVLARGGREVQASRMTTGALDRPTELVLSLIDRQISLAIGGREALVYPYEPPATQFRAPSQPFSIGDRGLDVQISRLQIWRDVYYTPAPRGGGAATVCQLKADEYFVLGDNSPISRDSRPWSGGEVFRAEMLVGRPLHVFRRGE